MGISESHFKFSFRIEAKPEGGFIGRSEDPAITLEGATREEVEEKIRAKVAEITGVNLAALPAEKLGAGAVNVEIRKKFAFSLKKTGEKQIADASSGQLDGATPAPIEPSGISPTTLIKVLVAVVVLLILLLLRRR
jgi:hypothetical protein